MGPDDPLHPRHPMNALLLLALLAPSQPAVTTEITGPARVTTECTAGAMRLRVEAGGAIITFTLAMPPAPVPIPAPAPAASIGRGWLVVIEETSQASASRGALLADQQLGAYLRERGWRWRIADRDAVDATGRPPADLVPYLNRARGKTLPWAILVGEDGKARYEGTLPATPAELLSALRKVGG